MITFSEESLISRRITLEIAGESDHISQTLPTHGNKKLSKLWYLEKQRLIFYSLVHCAFGQLSRVAVLHGKQPTDTSAYGPLNPAVLALNSLGNNTHFHSHPSGWSKSDDHTQFEGTGEYLFLLCSQRKQYQYTMYCLW